MTEHLQHIQLPEGSIEKQTTTLNLGPTHPATHGVFQNIYAYLYIYQMGDVVSGQKYFQL